MGDTLAALRKAGLSDQEIKAILAQRENYEKAKAEQDSEGKLASPAEDNSAAAAAAAAAAAPSNPKEEDDDKISEDLLNDLTVAVFLACNKNGMGLQYQNSNIVLWIKDECRKLATELQAIKGISLSDIKFSK